MNWIIEKLLEYLDFLMLSTTNFCINIRIRECQVLFYSREEKNFRLKEDELMNICIYRTCIQVNSQEYIE